MIGIERDRGSFLICSSNSTPPMSGSPRSSTMQSYLLGLQGGQCVLARCRRWWSSRRRCRSSRECSSAEFRRLPPAADFAWAARRSFSAHRTRPARLSLVLGFDQITRARPGCSDGSVSSSTVMMCTGMCRVAKSTFKRSSTRQPSRSGRCMSSVMACGFSSRARASAVEPRWRHNSLESLLVRHFQEDFARNSDHLPQSATRGRPGEYCPRSSSTITVAASISRW